MESFKENGKFWLPKNKDRKISGNLRFDPNEGARLELDGSLEINPFNIIKAEENGFSQLSPKFINPKIILGIINGKPVTLYNSRQFAAPMFISNFQESLESVESHFDIDKIFLGQHFQKEEDIQFERLDIIYSDLDYWVGCTGLKERFGKDSRDYNTFQWEYEYPPEVRVDVNSIQMAINFGIKRKFTPFKLIFKQYTFIRIEPTGTIHFNDYLEIINHLQDFLSLAVGRAVYPLKIQGKTRKDDPREFEIDINYRTDPVISSNTKNPRDMFFTLKDIHGSFEESLNNWFKKSEQLEIIRDLYFSTIYTQGLPLEIIFLNYIRALELYHRRVLKGSYLSIEEYEPIKEKIINSITGVSRDHKNSLKNRIKYGYEFSLRTRLKRIFDINENLFGLVFNDKNTFIEDIVVTRNYYTHYDESDKERALTKTDELYELTLKLKFILETCILIELGISEFEIKNFVANDDRYKGVILD